MANQGRTNRNINRKCGRDQTKVTKHGEIRKNLPSFNFFWGEKILYSFKFFAIIIFMSRNKHQRADIPHPRINNGEGKPGTFKGRKWSKKANCFIEYENYNTEGKTDKQTYIL